MFPLLFFLFLGSRSLGQFIITWSIDTQKSINIIIAAALTRSHRRKDERRSQREAFKIPVAGGEPITLALKYGNRAAGSAYRRLDKRCDARSIRPPREVARARPPRLSSLRRLYLCSSALARPARNHLLCTWLEADCYPGILPFLRPAWPSPDTWSHEPRSA